MLLAARGLEPHCGTRLESEVAGLRKKMYAAGLLRASACFVLEPPPCTSRSQASVSVVL